MNQSRLHLPGMGLRALRALAAGMIIIAAVVLSVILLVVRPQLSGLELELARKDAKAFQTGLDHQLEKVSTFAREYAYWDETYRITAGKAPSWGEDYFSGEVMSEQGIDFVLMTDSHGTILFARNWYRHGEFPQGYPLDLSKAPDLVRMATLESSGQTLHQGLVTTSEGMALAGAVGITNNDATAPENGVFLAGMILDADHVKTMAESLNLQARVWQVNATPADPVVERAMKHLENTTSGDWYDSGNSPGMLWKTLPDSWGKAELLMGVGANEGVNSANTQQLWFIMSSLMAGSMFLLFLGWLWLRRQVLAPLRAMAGAGETIRTLADYSIRLPGGPSREMETLSVSFNRLLDTLVDLNSNLEDKVALRTRELDQANLELTLMGEAYRNSIEGMIITDGARNIISVNPAFCLLTGYSSDEVLGKNPRILQSGHQSATFYKKLWHQVAQEGYWSGELVNKRKDGSMVPVWMSLSTIRDKEGKAVNYMAVMRDITEVKEQEKIMHFQAFFDSLTALPNRLLLRDRLEKALAINHRKGLRIAVLFLDLDNFKNVNDSLGHRCGDILLVEVSRRLKNLVRPSDTICRLGGDEFVIMLEELTDEQAAIHLAGRILETLAQPVEAEGNSLNVGASIGICISPEDGDNFDVLLRNADTAMYRAKEGGKNNFALFLPEMNERAVRRIRLEQDLPKAITSGQIRVWYQPKLDLASNRILGVEALVRWQRDDRIIQPMEFVPLAEDLGLVGALDQEVLFQACRDHRKVFDATGLNLKMAVNCSPKVLQDPELFDKIARTMDLGGMDARHLEIEITETCLMKDFAACLRVLNRFRSIGISLALDDFGTGYSSLVQLNRLPITTLKIDRSFVIDLLNYQTANIVTTILTMARGLGLSVVAEGVEEEYQREFLHTQGCNHIQGYLVAKPLPLEELIDIIRTEAALEPVAG